MPSLNIKDTYIVYRTTNKVKSGGIGGRGLVHTEGTKEKISKTTKGIKKPKSFCEKMSRLHKGKVTSEEVKRKQSEARVGRFFGESHPRYGKKHSVETRIKISNSRKGRPVPNTNVQFFTLLLNRVTYTKSTLSRWHPEFREYY